MNEIQRYDEPLKELAKNTKISIKLDGWPAALVCGSTVAGVTGIVIAIIKYCR